MVLCFLIVHPTKHQFVIMALMLLWATTLLSLTLTDAFTATPLLCGSSSSSKKTHHLLQASAADDNKEWDLRVAVVGAGPSGLLVAHRLLKSNLPLSNIDVFESRSDPRDTLKQQGSRAYALGLGIRGRSAIKTVDDDLWTAVKKRGFECERFRLHFNKKLSVKLRDREEGVEPSVLIYQTDLLLDELEKRSEKNSAQQCNVNVHYDANITQVDLINGVLLQTDQQEKEHYDLIVGCDGANSIVRTAMDSYSPPDTFQFTQRKLLPGCFKVARCEKMPPLLDQNSVALLLPKSVSVTAFVEPTVDEGCCILFAGKLSDVNSKSEEAGDDNINLNSLLFTDGGGNKLTKEMIFEQFPLLEDTPGMDDAVQQLINQRASIAQSVKCNIYNSPPTLIPTALCGDSAHATGGVSGQGANSALIDAAVLVDCLGEHYHPTKTDNNIAATKKIMLHKSLSCYSAKQVPEGLALYDLSFGNDGKTLPIFRNIRSVISNGIDTIFGGRLGIGRKPLQTLMASSLESFTAIRRDRQKYFVEEFPSDEELKKRLEEVYDGVKVTMFM